MCSMSTCVVFLKNKFLQGESLGHRLRVRIIFIKTINLFFYLSKTEYCHSLQFLLSDGQMLYLPAASITFLGISSAVIGHWYFFSCWPIHVLYLFSIELLDFWLLGPLYILYIVVLCWLHILQVSSSLSTLWWQFSYNQFSLRKAGWFHRKWRQDHIF